MNEQPRKELVEGNVVLNNDVLPYIEAHARSSDKEIYGWLIGYEQERDDVGSNSKYDAEKMSADGEVDLIVLAAYSCHDYQVQTRVGAEPNPSELSALNSMLPAGLSNLGMYHSHPKGVFHSHTDDDTLLQMAKVYPRVVSIVSNGEQTEVFKVIDGQVEEIVVHCKELRPQFVEFMAIWRLLLPMKDSYLSFADELDQKLKVMFSSKWNAGELDASKTKIRMTFEDHAINENSAVEMQLILRCAILRRDEKEIPCSSLEALSQALYGLLSSATNDIFEHSNRIVPYFGIPMRIDPGSAVHKTARKRAELLKCFGHPCFAAWLSVQSEC